MLAQAQATQSVGLRQSKGNGVWKGMNNLTLYLICGSIAVIEDGTLPLNIEICLDGHVYVCGRERSEIRWEELLLEEGF